MQDTTLREEIIKVIVAVQPNIKYKDLERLVANITVELPRLHELQVAEDA